MERIDFNAPYIDRRTWLLDHMENLHVDAKETMVLLLIDFYNQQNISIDHEILGKKLKLSLDEIEDIFSSLSDKGYLILDFANGHLKFDISGVYDSMAMPTANLNRSLLEQFEMEFGSTLSSSQMQKILDMASEYDEKFVLIALNEAVANDVRELNYIEKILATWREKGLSLNDLENGKR